MKVEIKVPALGESITEATVCNIMKESGSIVEMDEEIIELETDKVNQTINAPESGKLEFSVKMDDVVKVGQVIGSIDTESKPEKAKAAEEKKIEEPIEKELLKEEILPLEEEKEKPQIPPLKETEEEFLASFQKKPEEIQPPLPKKEEKMEEVKGRETRVRMTKLRRIIAEKLVSVKNQSAMLTTFNEVDMHAVMEFRKKEQENFQKKHDVKLGFMSFFIKASVAALQKYPELNAYLEQEEIVYRNYYDIGIAVGTEKGLMVPVLKDCDKKSFSELEKQLKDFAEKARTQKISVDDLRGGGFTITNGGVYGSMLSTPILNPPQSGILGMHAIQKRPIAMDEQVVIRPMMYLALSYDHRVVDGEEAIGFLVHIKNHLEEPTRLLVDL